MNPHPPFHEEQDLWTIDEKIPIEHQVMQITGELYDEMITSRVAKNILNTEPWVLLFVSDTDLLDSKRAY